MRRSSRSGANHGQPGPFGRDYEGPTTGPFAVRNQSLGKFAKLKASGDVFGHQRGGFWRWLRDGGDWS